MRNPAVCCPRACHRGLRRILTGVVLCAGSLAWLPAHAQAEVPLGPTVAELLAACERGRAAGDRGVDAALCEWYAVPCDCKGKAPATGPRWCLPAAESIDAALPKVLAALRAAPHQQAPALAVVPDIMARLYPCADAATP
jgi:hypothetical protein